MSHQKGACIWTPVLTPDLFPDNASPLMAGIEVWSFKYLKSCHHGRPDFLLVFCRPHFPRTQHCRNLGNKSVDLFFSFSFCFSVSFCLFSSKRLATCIFKFTILEQNSAMIYDSNDLWLRFMCSYVKSAIIFSVRDLIDLSYILGRLFRLYKSGGPQWKLDSAINGNLYYKHNISF